MKFEHRIEINHLDNPLIPLMTREQLWNGLVLRAEFPGLFISYLDACTITARDLDGLARVLQFGDVKIVDLVQFEFLNCVHYRVPLQGEIPESNMKMTIEEPVPGALSIRFSYEDGYLEAEYEKNAPYHDFRRSMYVEADTNMVSVLRELHKAGRLDNLLT
jgi:hypothetical protein